MLGMQNDVVSLVSTRRWRRKVPAPVLRLRIDSVRGAHAAGGDSPRRLDPLVYEQDRT